MGWDPWEIPIELLGLEDEYSNIGRNFGLDEQSNLLEAVVASSDPRPERAKNWLLAEPELAERFVAGVVVEGPVQGHLRKLGDLDAVTEVTAKEMQYLALEQC